MSMDHNALIVQFMFDRQEEIMILREHIGRMESQAIEQLGALKVENDQLTSNLEQAKAIISQHENRIAELEAEVISPKE